MFTRRYITGSNTTLKLEAFTSPGFFNTFDRLSCLNTTFTQILKEKTSLKHALIFLLNTMKVFSLMSPDSAEATPRFTTLRRVLSGGFHVFDSLLQHARTYLVSAGICFDRVRRFSTPQTLMSRNSRVQRLCLYQGGIL